MSATVAIGEIRYMVFLDSRTEKPFICEMELESIKPVSKKGLRSRLTWRLKDTDDQRTEETRDNDLPAGTPAAAVFRYQSEQINDGCRFYAHAGAIKRIIAAEVALRAYRQKKSRNLIRQDAFVCDCGAEFSLRIFAHKPEKAIQDKSEPGAPK